MALPLLLPDRRFRRDGADLWCDQTVELVDAVLGTNLRVPTLDEKVEVAVPPATQPETTLRLAGKGLPEFGRAGRGDLLVSLHVHIPERLSAQERELYERLRALSAKTQPDRI